MKNIGLLSLGLLLFPVAACSTAQVANTQAVLAAVPAELAAACATASSAAAIAQATVKGGAVNTVNNVAGYITAGCATGEAVASLAADPSSTDWVKGLTAQINAVPAS